MRVFKKPNTTHGWKCPVCGTNEKKEVILIAVSGTEDGNIVEAEQFHLDCINLVYYSDQGVIAQKF